MALIAKTRLSKRKYEMQNTRKENQTETSKKHDKRCIVNPKENSKHVEPNKTGTNDDFKIMKDKLKLTNELNDALLEEVKENEEAIKILQAKEKKHVEAIKSLEENITKLKSEKVLKSSAETQTVYEFQDIPCKDCIYVASCAEELDFHIENVHWDDDDGPSETVSESPYNCNICSKRNSNWGDLRCHLKTMHPGTVRTCKFFLLGKCDFPENVCWFMHTKPNTTLSPCRLSKSILVVCGTQN